jgi:catechol 2,3-dioxygenase-like lactoylglutathione lyase family enzyme
MSDMTTVEVKAFVPARDFALSKQFYQDLGFVLAWSSDDLAYLRHGNSTFLLQNFYNKTHADNFMMHLLVQDVDAWWRHVQAQGLIAKYGSKAEPPADRPWGMRDFVIVDPTGRAVAHRAKHVSGRTSATIRAMMKPPNSVLAATRTAANVRPVRSPSSGGN